MRHARETYMSWMEQEGDTVGSDQEGDTVGSDSP